MKTHSASLIFMSALLFLLLSLTIHTRAEVITLTADTFSDKMCFSSVPNFWQIGKDLMQIIFFISYTQTHMAGIPNPNPAHQSLVKEKDTAWFVKFCVPWCKHCKNLGSLWEDLGKVIEGEDEIEIGEVDCSTSKPVCSKVDIHSYPTFKLFYDGEEVAKYQGPRDVESLKAFVLEEAEKAATKSQLDSDKEL